MPALMRRVVERVTTVPQFSCPRPSRLTARSGLCRPSERGRGIVGRTQIWVGTRSKCLHSHAQAASVPVTWSGPRGPATLPYAQEIPILLRCSGPADRDLHPHGWAASIPPPWSTR